MLAVEMERIAAASGDAVLTSGAEASLQPELSFRAHRLRIGAPLTPEWTALEKYDGSDPWAVMYIIELDMTHLPGAGFQAGPGILQEIRSC